MEILLHIKVEACACTGIANPRLIKLTAAFGGHIRLIHSCELEYVRVGAKHGGIHAFLHRGLPPNALENVNFRPILTVVVVKPPTRTYQAVPGPRFDFKVAVGRSVNRMNR